MVVDWGIQSNLGERRVLVVVSHQWVCPSGSVSAGMVCCGGFIQVPNVGPQGQGARGACAFLLSRCSCSCSDRHLNAVAFPCAVHRVEHPDWGTWILVCRGQACGDMVSLGRGIP